MPMKRILSIIILCILLLAGQVWGADKYVDGALGTDDVSHGTGTGANAWKTMQYALTGSRVAKGDTLHVAAGTYEEVQTQPLFAAGTGGTVTITGPDGATPAVNINIKSGITNASYFVVGLTTKWKNINFTNTGSVVKSWFYLYASANMSTWFENCTFTGNTASSGGIFAYSAATGFTCNVYLNRCKLQNNTTVIKSKDNSVDANIWVDSSLATNNVSLVLGDTNAPTDAVLRNNTIILPTSGGAYAANLQTSGSTLRAVNNIIVLQYASQYAFSAGSTVAAEWIVNPTRWDVRDNIYWFTGTLTYQAVNPMVYSPTGELLPVHKTNKMLNPAFTNFGGGDYTLTSSSWAAGRGSSASSDHPTDNLDYTGTTLGLSDVGCYVNPTKVPDPVKLTGKVVFFGDSIMAGVGASSGQEAYTKFAAMAPSATVVGGSTVAIAGIMTAGAIPFLDKVLLDNAPKVVLVAVGINDVATPKINQTNAQLAVELETILEKIVDYGARPIWLGIETLTGNPPDNTNVKAVNALVEAYCSAHNISYGSILDRMELNTNWKTTYYADLTTNVHPDNDGHLLIASLAENIYMGRNDYHVADTNYGTADPSDGAPATYQHPMTIAGLNGLSALSTGETGRTIEAHGTLTTAINTPVAGASGKILTLTGGTWPTGNVFDQQYWKFNYAVVSDSSGTGITNSAANNTFDHLAITGVDTGVATSEDTTLTSMKFFGVTTDISVTGAALTASKCTSKSPSGAKQNLSISSSGTSAVSVTGGVSQSMMCMP